MNIRTIALAVCVSLTAGNASGQTLSDEVAALKIQTSIVLALLAPQHVDALKHRVDSETNALEALPFTPNKALNGADKDLVELVRDCAAGANSLVKDIDPAQITGETEKEFKKLTEKCGPENLKEQSDKLVAQVVDAVKDCGVDFGEKPFNIETLAKETKRLGGPAGECVKPIVETLGDVSKSVGQFAATWASVQAVCTMFPDPYVCGSAAVIAILLEIFNLFGGDGDGDGNGDGGGKPGEGPGKVPGTGPNPPARSPWEDRLPKGGDCQISGADIKCGNVFTFEKANGKAELSANDPEIYGGFVSVLNAEQTPILALTSSTYVKQGSVQLIPSRERIEFCLFAFVQSAGGTLLKIVTTGSNEPGQQAYLSSQSAGKYSLVVTGRACQAESQ